MPDNFSNFFQHATGMTDSYPYQREFASAKALPHLLGVPTGAGKTAAAILGWLWRFQNVPATPRRLVYCLPMRVLVEQSHREASKWIKNLGLESDIDVHVLMGGADTDDWHLRPERPAILIGTQDMLLSRALNRGYAASRFHWPIDFALLNNDCLWVFDEPQLMGSGVSTSAQLAGLRKTLGLSFDCPSVWMSATLEPDWLDTIDFRGRFPEPPLELTDADYDPKLPLNKRMTAAKVLRQFDTPTPDARAVAKAIFETHEVGTQTLVIVNTVDRAKDVYSELAKLRKKSPTPALLLVHSRFRPAERELLNVELQGKSPGDCILIATQVVEAGVDISSRTLISDLAPWASMVQRIGRCNRTGDDGSADNPARVSWIDLPEKSHLPYEVSDLDFARDQLVKLEGKDVSPKSLDDFKRTEDIKLPFEHKHVLRRRDLIDLFDTTPDLSGNDIDIQRFVRSDDPDTDVQVFWREFNDAPGEQLSPERAELCSVPVGQFKKFIEGKDGANAYVWDHLEDIWAKLEARQVRPGLVIMLPCNAGGYSSTTGWDSGSKSKVDPSPLMASVPNEATGSDPNSASPVALMIAQHTSNVVAEVRAILKALGLDEQIPLFESAARWHDVGKALPACQNAYVKLNNTLDLNRLWAKSGKKGKLRYDRPHFRHELGSALAALQQSLPFDVAYLIAAHHGKVRLSIRSLPGENMPDDEQTLFALGIRSGDVLPSVDLGDGVTSPLITLDLTPMQLGGDTSWTAHALDLLKEHGPFKLAFLEAILRIADVRASKKEAESC
ncbi:MAG: CRISPR-associated helicase Cas3' [Planctomycetia bacterium]|nr:CRISPR-associated helicase Cas3' [Planctomycetia bacterium]